MEHNPPLYPTLELTASAPPDQTFRLAEAGLIRDSLARDAAERGRTRKAYKRAAALVTFASIVLASLGAACSAAAIATASTLPLASLPLSAVALGLGLLTSVGGVLTRFLVRKAAKHSHIELLAANRGDAVAALVSSALEDGRVSEAEFKLLLAEREHYHKAVAQIRARERRESARPPVDTEELKKEMRALARKELLAEITTKATA